jgi:hypothetical protein
VRTLTKCLVVVAASTALAGEQAITSTVELVIANAKSHADYKKVSDAFVGSLTVEDFGIIARRLLIDRNDLEQLGDSGVTYKFAAVDFALAKLGEMPGGGPLIIDIADDERITIDGAISLSVCDAAVRRGPEMLPLLQHAKNRSWATYCSELIRAGRKTAF